MKKLILFLICSVTMAVSAQTFKHTKIVSETVGYITMLDSKDQLWYVDKTDNKLFMCKNTDITEQDLVLPESSYEMLEEENGTIWGVSQKGIICYKNNEWSEYQYGNEDAEGMVPFLIFKDNQNRVYFFNAKSTAYASGKAKNIVVFENEKLTIITENLPEKIVNVTTYKNGIIFGEYESNNPCGYYNGSYQLISEGNIFNFYNSWEGKFTSDATNIENPEKFEKYTHIKETNRSGDHILILNDQTIALYNIETQAIKEYHIKGDYDKFLNSDLVLMHYENNRIYIVSAKDGILEIDESGLAILYTKKQGILGNVIADYFIDKHNNLVLLFSNSSSVLVDGKWKNYDKDSGYNLNNFIVRHKHIDLNGYKYITAYDAGGNKSVLLQWDGDNWKSFEFITGSDHFVPVVFKNAIWFRNNKNNKSYKGMIYFNGESFTEYSFGNSNAKENYVPKGWCSENVFYACTTNLWNFKSSLVKIELD